MPKETAHSTTYVAPIDLWEVPKDWFVKTYCLGITWVLIVITSIMIGLWPLGHLYLHAKIAEFEAVNASITVARMSHPPEGDAEMRGIQTIIAQWNGWLAYWKEWDKVPFIEYYVPDRIKRLKPIE